jgi:hypothetical protein
MIRSLPYHWSAGPQEATVARSGDASVEFQEQQIAKQRVRGQS